MMHRDGTLEPPRPMLAPALLEEDGTANGRIRRHIPTIVPTHPWRKALLSGRIRAQIRPLSRLFAVYNGRQQTAKQQRSGVCLKR